MMSIRTQSLERASSSADWRGRDLARVWHPFTPMSAFAEDDAPTIVAGDGFHLIDAEGRRYLDGVASLWCNVHGHRVPAIDQAIREQLDRISHSTLLGLGSDRSIELAEALVRRAPEGLAKVFYSDSGATAVEAALKIVYQYQRQRRDRPGERDLFIALGDAYHGDTLGAVSVGGVELFHGVYQGLLFPTVRIPAPTASRARPGVNLEQVEAACRASLEQALEDHRDRIAGIVLEPIVQGAAGILTHPRGFLKWLREIATRWDVPLIADEVAVGFGKLGSLFACEQEGVTPDVLCVAKGLTGGYLPLAATLTTDRIYDAFLGRPEEKRTFYHGHTYTGNALGCAAALASLALFEKNDVLGQALAIEKRLGERLRSIKDHPFVGDIRHRGVMVGIELVQDRSSGTSFDPRERRGHQVTLKAREQGVIVRPLGDVVVLMPAPAMPLDWVDRLCDVVFDGIDVVTGATGA